MRNSKKFFDSAEKLQPAPKPIHRIQKVILKQETKLKSNKKPRAGKRVALRRERAILHTQIRLAQSTEIKNKLINKLKHLRWANPKTIIINKQK